MRGERNNEDDNLVIRATGPTSFLRAPAILWVWPALAGIRGAAGRFPSAQFIPPQMSAAESSVPPSAASSANHSRASSTAAASAPSIPGPAPPASAPPASSGPPRLSEVLPKSGLVYSEKGNLGEVLCKPKIMPIKSITLQKIEQMENRAAEMMKQGKNA